MIGNFIKMITVAIVEDNDTIRNGLKHFLNETDNFKCVADYSNCENLIDSLPAFRTDIVLMDINLPGISGIEGIKEIKKLVSNQKIIILTVHAETENIFEALAAGAFGYLEKKTPPLQMLTVIEDVYNHKSKMNTYIARKINSFFTAYNKNWHKEELNKNEFMILKNLTEGHSPKALADQFNVPTETIYEYFYQIYDKLHQQFEMMDQSIIRY